MNIIRITLSTIISLYIVVLWARFVIDWARVLAPRWHPKGALLVLCEGVYTLTDPPLNFIRKYIPPLQVGNMALDVAWLILLIGCGLLRTLVLMIF